jgi:hypothetical protein
MVGASLIRRLPIGPQKPHVSHISHAGPLNEMEQRQGDSERDKSGKFRMLFGFQNSHQQRRSLLSQHSA